MGTKITPRDYQKVVSELLIEIHSWVAGVMLECWHWHEIVHEIEFYFPSLPHDVRIDIRAFMQWGCGSDLVPVGMNYVKHANSCLKGELSFYSYILWSGLEIPSLLNSDCKRTYFLYWLCEFPLVHSWCLCGSPFVQVTCSWSLFCWLPLL